MFTQNQLKLLARPYRVGFASREGSEIKILPNLVHAENLVQPMLRFGQGQFTLVSMLK
jgi:hypothetical protein